jgi:hypothetical protein
MKRPVTVWRKMTLKDLKIGQLFYFKSAIFIGLCRKIGPRRIRRLSTGVEYRIFNTLSEVYPI